MKYDVIKTGEYSYRLVDKETGKPVHIGDLLNTEWDKRAAEKNGE